MEGWIPGKGISRQQPAGGGSIFQATFLLLQKAHHLKLPLSWVFLPRLSTGPPRVLRAPSLLSGGYFSLFSTLFIFLLPLFSNWCVSGFWLRPLTFCRRESGHPGSGRVRGSLWRAQERGLRRALCDLGTCLVVQRLRTRLAMQGTRVRSLVRELKSHTPWNQ